MIPTAQNSNLLLNLIEEEGLYQNLLKQIKKDFEFTGLSISINTSTSPIELLNELHFQVENLINSNFDRFLQLLYRIDIPEQTAHFNSIQESNELAKKTCFTILKREWQKVYLKNKYA